MATTTTTTTTMNEDIKSGLLMHSHCRSRAAKHTSQAASMYSVAEDRATPFLKAKAAALEDVVDEEIDEQGRVVTFTSKVPRCLVCFHRIECTFDNWARHVFDYGAETDPERPSDGLVTVGYDVRCGAGCRDLPEHVTLLAARKPRAPSVDRLW